MLDVHAPEHRVGGLRDFFVHLATITVGLLIALMLENAAEAVHHRQQRREAEEKIREEIRHNLDDLIKNASVLEEERATMKQFIGVLRIVQQGKPLLVTGQTIKLSFHEEEIPDAAWRTASSTGVLEYLPYDEVERFSDAYREQALLQQIAQRTLNDYLEITPDTDHQPTKDDSVTLLPIALRALGDLNGLAAAGSGTVEAYQAALK